MSEAVVALANPSLEAVNLSKHFGSFVAVSDLNLKIEGSKRIGLHAYECMRIHSDGSISTEKMLHL